MLQIQQMDRKDSTAVPGASLESLSCGRGGKKEAVVKTAAAAPQAPALGVFSPLPKTLQHHSGACDDCQILLAQKLFSLPERNEHSYGRLTAEKNRHI